MFKNYDKAELKNIELVKDGGSYYLDVTYNYENKYGLYELNIPRILLPICKNMLPDYRIDMPRYYDHSIMTVDFGFGDLEVLRDFKTGMTHKITEIQKKTHKMTLAEVEEALGYKVELISE